MKILVNVFKDDEIISVRREWSDLLNELSGHRDAFRHIGVAVGQIVSRLTTEFNVPADEAVKIIYTHADAEAARLVTEQ